MERKIKWLLILFIVVFWGSVFYVAKTVAKNHAVKQALDQAETGKCVIKN